MRFLNIYNNVRHIGNIVLVFLISYLMMTVGLAFYADMFGKPQKSNYLDVWLILSGINFGLYSLRIIYLKLVRWIKRNQ